MQKYDCGGVYMLFSFIRQGTEIEKIPMSNDDREILEQIEIDGKWLESLNAIESEVNYAI